MKGTGANLTAVLPPWLTSDVNRPGICVNGQSVPSTQNHKKHFPRPAFNVTRVRAVVQTTRVYSSRRALRLVYQVFDAANNTHVIKPERVQMHLSLDGADAEQINERCENSCRYSSYFGCADGGIGSDSARCELGTDCDSCGSRFCSPPDDNTGIGLCEDEVPEEWFSGTALHQVRIHVEVYADASGSDLLVTSATTEVELMPAPSSQWGANWPNFLIGGALPNHPVFDDETFSLQMYGRSEAPPGGALLATHQVDVWRATITWEPPDALQVVSFERSPSWREATTNPSPASSANGADGLQVLVSTIADIEGYGTHGSGRPLFPGGACSQQAHAGPHKCHKKRDGCFLERHRAWLSRGGADQRLARERHGRAASEPREPRCIVCLS